MTSGNECSPQIALARLADGAGGRIGPERLVVRAAVVVAGEPEAAGHPQDQQRRRERAETAATTPGFGRRTSACGDVAEEQRRVERREVRAELVVRVLEPRPGRVDDERGESEERQQRTGATTRRAGSSGQTAELWVETSSHRPRVALRPHDIDNSRVTQTAPPMLGREYHPASTMRTEESVGRWRAVLGAAATVNLIVGVALSSRGGRDGDLFRSRAGPANGCTGSTRTHWRTRAWTIRRGRSSCSRRSPGYRTACSRPSGSRPISGSSRGW